MAGRGKASARRVERGACGSLEDREGIKFGSRMLDSDRDGSTRWSERGSLHSQRELMDMARHLPTHTGYQACMSGVLAFERNDRQADPGCEQIAVPQPGQRCRSSEFVCSLSRSERKEMKVNE